MSDAAAAAPKGAKQGERRALKKGGVIGESGE